MHNFESTNTATISKQTEINEYEIDGFEMDIK